MEEPAIWITVLGGFLGVLFFLKMYILFQAARHANARRWFYFTQQEIIEAPTEPIARLRKIQNALTAIFFIVAALTLLLLYLFNK